MDNNNLMTTQIEFEKELKHNILSYWIENTIDLENGGFFGKIFNNSIPDKTAKKGSILNSRILWTFAKAYSFFNEPEYLDTANIAFTFMKDVFWDKNFSGLYWMADYKVI